MWFADIICNLAWFESAQGNLGTARIKQPIPSGVEGVATTMCLYGTDSELTHARVVMDVHTHDEANQISNDLIEYWVGVLAVASGITSQNVLRPELFPQSNSYAVVLGEGDELAKSVAITTHSEPFLVDFLGLGKCVANWQPTCRAHLFFMGKFLDSSLPLDVRWLNGYRLAEWHFQRNSAGLAGNNQWRELLELFRSDLEVHLRPNQSLHGFIEEARALAAHALLDNRPLDHRITKPGDQILWSFPVMERIVMHIGNLPELNRGLVTLQPKS